jgi:hypothetical protein
MFKFASALALIAVSATATETEGVSGHADLLPTYGWRKGKGYGIYNELRKPKPLIANDGYRVKRRTDIYDRSTKTIDAKCVLLDPEDEDMVNGIIRMQQTGKEPGTEIMAHISGIGHGKYELSINALGDLRDGCDSAGAVFSPNVSKSG